MKRLLSRILCIALLCLAADGAFAAEVVFIAGDKPDDVPVSDLVWFRLSPYGGLVATQWVSNVTLNGQALFPYEGTGVKAGTTIVSKQNLDEMLETGNLREEEKMLKSVKGRLTSKDRKPRPVDQVDPLYAGFDERYKIGPQKVRYSYVFKDIDGDAVIEPGGHRIEVRGDSFRCGSPCVKVVKNKIYVKCYPVRIRAARPDRASAFVPRLTWKRTDLLGRMLFDYSPDCPAGVLAEDATGAARPHGAEPRTPRSDLAFFDLTVYLPPCAKGAALYKLNGVSFNVSEKGVELPQAADTLRKTGDFDLQVVLPAPPPAALTSVKVTRLATARAVPGLDEPLVRLPKRDLAVAAPAEGTIQFAIPGAVKRVEEVRYKLAPGGASGFVYRELAIDETDGRPAVFSFGTPRAAATASGRLALWVTCWAEAGQKELPASFGATLTDAAGKARELTFSRGAADTWSADVSAVPAGLDALTFPTLLTPGHPLRLLVCIVNKDTRGSLSVFTPDNRSDYLRGERVSLTVVARAAGPAGDTPAAVILRHESGVETKLGTLTLRPAPGRPAGEFFTFTTDALRPGRYTVRAETDGFVSHPAPLTVRQREQISTFPTFVQNSVATPPIRVGRDVFIHHVKVHSPLTYLFPDEEADLKAGGRIPASYRDVCAADPFWPAPQRTAEGAERELEMAAAQRLGIVYYPHYGWGLGPYESNWNPKHSLPEELARMRRLCSLVVQRYRDFANFGGLHLNWYPTLKGYWEGNPVRDGNAGPRAKAMYEEAWRLTGPPPAGSEELKKQLASAKPTDPLYVAKAAQALRDWNVRYRDNVSGALPRAYAAWTASCSGFGDYIYSSWVPVNWFRRTGYYAPRYFATLPIVSQLVYTDYGFSAFQAVWAIDYYCSGLREKPLWVSTIATTRGTMVRHTLLTAMRGASALDFGAWQAQPEDRSELMGFLERYGPYFNALQPVSDVAILGSHRQIVNEGGGPGSWGGHTGGDYFALYSHLWFACRPATFITDEEVALANLKRFRALFLIGQRVPLHPAQMRALDEYLKAGGIVYKDAKTSPFYPGVPFDLKPDGRKRYPSPYKNMDPTHVGAWAGYLSVQDQMTKLLAPLGPPVVSSDRPNILVAARRGADTLAVGAVDETHPPAEITHTWSFWQSTYLAVRGNLTFDAPWVVYDLFNGGREIALTQKQGDRWVLPVDFNRIEGLAFLCTRRPIRGVRLTLPVSCPGGARLPVKAVVTDADGHAFTDPLPCEISLIGPDGRATVHIYRALNADRTVELTAPANAKPGDWTVKVHELASGKTATGTVRVTANDAAPAGQGARVVIPHEADVRRLLSSCKKITILLDEGQESLLPVARKLADALKAADIPCDTIVFDPYSAWDIPLRWRRTKRDEALGQKVVAGELLAKRHNLHMTYFPSKQPGASPPFIEYPDSGWTELGPRHLIYRNVIVLGTPAASRFVADLHETVGRSLTDPLPGTALVQAIADGFAPRFSAFSIQAADLEGATRGADALAQLAKPRSPQPAPSPVASAERKDWPAAHAEPLRNLARDRFGRSVYPAAWLKDGGKIMVTAAFDACNWILLDSHANLIAKAMRRATINISGKGNALWIHNWLGQLCPADKDMNARWRMSVPGLGLRGVDWSCSGRQFMTDPTSDDVFLAGMNYATRLKPDGETAWTYDDTQTWTRADDMRYPRGVSLLGISPDGRYLLAMAFGTRMYYVRYVTALVRPEAILLDAHTGKVLWRKPGLSLNHAAAAITNDYVMLCNGVKGDSFVVIYDLAGQEKWRIWRPAGLSEGRITSDGKYIIGRGIAFADKSALATGPTGPLESISIDTRRTRPFPLADRMYSFSVAPDGQNVLISTADGFLSCYRPDTTLAWRKRLPRSAFLWSSDGREVMVGTALGRLLCLSRDGKEVWQKDLMPYNMIEDWGRYIREYKENPGENAPLRFLFASAGKPIDARQRPFVKFSKNLLADEWTRDGEIAETTDPRRGKCLAVKGRISQRLRILGGKTYVLSLFQRRPDPEAKDPAGLVLVKVTKRGQRAPLYACKVRVSAPWEERTFSWRFDSGADADVSIEYVRPAKSKAPPEGVVLGDVALYTVRYPSGNVLKRGGTTAAVDFGDELKPETPSLKVDIDQTIPQDKSPQGRMPLKPKSSIYIFNGNLNDPETSWMRSSVSGMCSCAFMTIKLAEPHKFAAFAVYEDPADPSRFTRTYGLFVHNAKTKQWRMVGHVLDNESPFNLFSFEPELIDEIQYFWHGSPDGHVRVMEMEGYLTGADALIMP